MEQLLRKLGINPNQSNESILDELGKKQMEYQERLESVEDEKRRAQLEAELKEMEGVINTLSWLSKRSETGMKREEEPTESFEELKGQPQEKDVETLSVEVQESMQGKTEEELYDAALAIMATPDYAKGVEMMRQLAENGYHPAQCQMGKLYAEGNRVLKDESIATEWYRKAAEQGNAEAQSNLGYRYEAGIGVKQNDNLAAEWYRKAAEQGDAFAQACLGLFYVQGKGVVQSNRQAIVWSEKAAEQGNVIGQGTLGAIYEFDEIYKNDELAAEWYLKAAKQNHIVAAERLIVMYTEKRGNVKKEDLEFAWIEQAAGEGNAKVQVLLGEMYEEGSGVEQDYELAVEWYQKAANQGNAKAMMKVGEFLERKGEVKRALEWYRKVAISGDVLKKWQEHLNNSNRGDWYSEKEVFHKYDETSEEVIYIKALAGDVQAQCNMGKYFDKFETIYQSGHFWYQRAGEQGYGRAFIYMGKSHLKHYTRTSNMASKNILYDSVDYCCDKAIKVQKDLRGEAMFLMAKMYKTIQDEKRALDYYKRAADDGYEEAMLRLGEVFYYGQMGMRKDRQKAKEYLLMIPQDSDTWKMEVSAELKKLFETKNSEEMEKVDETQKPEEKKTGGFWKRLFGN